MLSSDQLQRLSAALADRYRIERRLGSGGMATVYLAQDLKHHRNVAIKVLRPELAAILGAERFLREIEIAAHLTHAHILPLYDSGEAGGFLYFVMPYVEGESLRAKLAREGQLPIPDAVRILRDIVDALASAHKHGVVHRDIKPDNVLLAENNAYVTDFGVAKAVSVATGRPEVSSSGVALGTPTYMAPEQGGADRPVDHRADIYSVGVVAYELLTGRPPFDGPTPQKILGAHMTQVPRPVTAHRETVPLALAEFVMKCLEKQPADRWQSAEEMVHQLEAIVTPTGGVAPHVYVARRRWWPVGVAVGLLVTTGLASAVLLRRERLPVVASASRIAVMPFAPTMPDTALARVGRDLVVTVSANLDGVGDIRAVDPAAILLQTQAGDVPLPLERARELAARYGAASLVHGNLVRVGNRVRLEATLVETDALTLVARVAVTAAPEDIASLTDSLTWGLLRQVWRRGKAPSPLLGRGMTPSIPALRAFLEGEGAMVESRYPAAADAFRRAFEADSVFWLAYWRYARARRWIYLPVEDHVQEALRAHASDLPVRERLLVEGLEASPRTVQIATLQELTVQFPDYWSGWMEYGDRLFHVGTTVGHELEEAIEAFERTVELNPGFTAAWEHLASAALWVSDTVTSARAIAALERLDARDLFIEGWGYDRLLLLRVWHELLRTGGRPTAPLLDSLVEEFATRRILIDEAQRFMSLALMFVGFPEQQVAFSRRVINRTNMRDVAANHRRGLAFVWAARGAWDSALTTIEEYRHRERNGLADLEAYRLAVVGTWLGAVPQGEASPLRPAVSPEQSPAYRAELAWLDGLRGVSMRNPALVRTARERIRSVGGNTTALLDRSLAAFELELTGRRRDAAESLAALEWAAADSAQWSADHPFLPTVNRLALSQWLAVEGDTTQAVRILAWHRSGPNPIWTANLVGSPLAHLQRARLLGAGGNAVVARQAYGEFLRRYDMPVAAHRHLVEEAEAALARLSGLSETVPLERQWGKR